MKTTVSKRIVLVVLLLVAGAVCGWGLDVTYIGNSPNWSTRDSEVYIARNVAPYYRSCSPIGGQSTVVRQAENAVFTYASSRGDIYLVLLNMQGRNYAVIVQVIGTRNARSMTWMLM